MEQIDVIEMYKGNSYITQKKFESCNIRDERVYIVCKTTLNTPETASPGHQGLQERINKNKKKKKFEEIKEVYKYYMSWIRI